VSVSGCTITDVTGSLIVALLAERPVEELEATMRKLDAARDKTRADLARIEVERGQVAEALERQTRRVPRTERRPGARQGSTRDRILGVTTAQDEPLTAPQVMAALPDLSRGAVYNALGRLVSSGSLDRTEDGRYQLASRDGVAPDAGPGLSESGASGPLFTAALPQEGNQE
jgi:hypothetical protein